MTDTGARVAGRLVRSPLSVSAYFDEACFAREVARIFAQSSSQLASQQPPQLPHYIGHQLMVPEVGDWRSLPQEGGGRVLVRSAGGVELLSNVCRHRQAVMLGGVAGRNSGGTASGDVAPVASGNLKATGGNIVCPLHRWTYTSAGELLGAPLFDERPCLNLQRFPLTNCHGLLFEGGNNTVEALAPLLARPEFDFSGYVLDHVEVHQCHYNWKTFIEVYLEDYHVGPFHPGLGRFVTCDDLRWEFSEHYSVQRVGVHQALGQPGSDVYRRWHERLLDYRGGEPPDFGAIWVTVFPTLMIEVYPHVLVVSTLHPRGPQETLNLVEFYYPEDIAAFEREFVEAQRAAYMETAVEDDEIAERMDAGRLALLRRGADESGPYQSPMEDGMQHFHQWYQQIMSDAPQQN